jgi:hypothetical protein
MSIRLALLKSGEDIVADIVEMNVGDDENPRVVGYYLRKPCIVKLQEGAQVLTEESSLKNNYSIKIYPWMPLSKDEVIPIPADWVVTITNPVEQLYTMYTEEVLKDENDSSDESSDSSSRD